MDWPVIFQEIFTGGAHIAVFVPAIIIPLMVVLALLTDSRLLDRGVGFIQPVFQRLNLSSRVAFPFLAGLFLGIVFGSGIIISYAKDGTLTKRDLVIVLVFLGICHSVIEDAVIFAALGANWWVLISCRFVLAAFAAFAVSFVVPLGPVEIKTN
ncbi:MAG: nucleoside recognition domain-containing protein [Desulfobacterales bacterium]